MRATREHAAIIREGVRAGIPAKHIKEKYGDFLPDLKTVQRIAADYRSGRDRYDDYIDEVAIERTLSGDVAVGLRLTRFEREEVIRRIADHDLFGEEGFADMVSSALGLSRSGLRHAVGRTAA